MICKQLHTFARLAVVVAVLAGFGALAGPALAASGTQQVSGTTVSELSLTPGASALFGANFAPGNTASASSTLTATDTSPSWTLQVQDASASAAPGHMTAAATGCTNSEASLSNPLAVTVTTPLGGATSAGQVSMSATNQTVSSSSSAPLAATTFTDAYSQTILSSESMVSGCVYSVTATYTLQ